MALIKELKIGDRIIVTSPQGLSGDERTCNKTGTIKWLRHGIWDFLVEFDEEFIGGHNGGGNCKDGHGRWGYCSEVSPLNNDWDV